LSDIRANTISDAAGTGPIDLYKQSAAKAWSVFTTSVSITGSFNVSSMTDIRAGEYQTTLTNSMASTTYVALGGVQNFNAILCTTAKTTSSWYNQTSREDNSGLADLADMQNVAHGDLA